MKRTKRKYTRKATTTPVESKSSGIEQGSKVIVPIEANTHDLVGQTIVYDSDKTVTRCISEFSFEDLPLSLRMQVENTLKMRKRLGLPDDEKERKAQIIKMFRGDRAR